MGKPTGFMEFARELPESRDKEARLGDYREFVAPWSEEQARAQGSRCMDCGIPFCHQGCPLGNPIPDFNDAVSNGAWERAFRALSDTNNFPEFTGRLCPAPCEAACTLAINREAVAIEQLEKEIIERAFREGWVKPQPPASRSGKRVAVIGSGPAGLAAAAQLNRIGHEVIVYERDDRVGGLLRYGIPDFKMEKWVIDRRVSILEAEGVVFKTGIRVGEEMPYDELRATHDAILLAVGARTARDLDVPGRELDGVVFAMDFLEQQNRRVATLPTPEPALTAAGKRVIILGGGDTGSDCLGTSLRQGARDVRQIELLPQPPITRGASNPWPQWPLVLSTSSSQEEGGDRGFGMATKELIGHEGRITGLRAVNVRIGDQGLEELPGTETQLDVDLLILAMGFTGPETAAVRAQLGVELDPRGNVKVDERFTTNQPDVFAAGDARRGASLIVWAISDGREAARSIDRYLSGKRSLLATRGAHLHFGGR